MATSLFFYRKALHSYSFLIVFLCLNILAGCKNNDEKKTKNLTTVRVGITTSFLGEAATFTAQEQEFFKENGLEVIFKHNTSGGISIEDLFQGDIDIAHVAETPVVYTLLDTSYIEGKKHPSFQIFADMMYTDEIQHIIARKDHGITEPKDIVGKKIAIYQDTQLDYFFDSFLLEHNMVKENVELVNMEPADQVDAIANGNIDVSVIWEPYATYIQQNLGEQALILDTKLTYSTLWLATTLDSYAEENPEVLVSYLRAIKGAQDYITNHPKETQQLLSQKTGVPIEAVISSWDEIDYELSLSRRMLTLLEEQARWMVRNSIADTSGLNFNRLINIRPMRTVYPEGITIIQ